MTDRETLPMTGTRMTLRHQASRTTRSGETMIKTSDDWDTLYNLFNKNLMEEKNVGDDFALESWNKTIRQFAEIKQHGERRIHGIGGKEDGGLNV